MTPALADPAATSPVVAVDVDGVLNPTDAHRAAAGGYRPHPYAGPTPAGDGHVTGTVWLHPDHGPWLREILAAGADLVWCTSWRQLAATWIAPRLGLPTMPVIDVTVSGVRWGHQFKLGPLYTATGTRPVAVLDDELGAKDAHQAADRTAAGIPTLLVPIAGHHGLQRHHIDQVLAWLTGR